VNNEWQAEADEILARDIDRPKLEMLAHAERLSANRFNSLLRSLGRQRKRMDALEDAMQALADDVTLSASPAPPEAEERSQDATPLVDSDDGYYAMVEALKARKKYDD
jgi:hypothetical protein